MVTYMNIDCSYEQSSVTFLLFGIRWPRLFTDLWPIDSLILVMRIHSSHIRYNKFAYVYDVQQLEHNCSLEIRRLVMLRPNQRGEMNVTSRIAVTGALGNVGRIVVGHLRERGFDVVEIDLQSAIQALPSSTAVAADLTSYDETLRVLEGADVVVHFAGINAPIFDPPWKVHNTNVTASYNVMSAAVQLGISRVVQSSSVNAIGSAWSRKPEFDYFPVDTLHRSRVEDPYSLSKLFQELQADSIVRRNPEISIVSLRLHAVLLNAHEARVLQQRLGDSWAVNGLFGYCTHDSVVSAVELACFAPIAGHEVLLVVEPETFVTEPSAQLAAHYYPEVPLRSNFAGHEGFFDTSRTTRVLGWQPSTSGEFNNPLLKGS